MKKQKAVFLDRDGTISREIGHFAEVRHLILLPGVARAIRKLNEMGFLTVMITNQAGVAKGILTEDVVQEIHRVLIGRLARRGARIDAVYYCPHHPEGVREEYRMVCECRKPNIGMIRKAIKELGIDPQNSFVVGDATTDILAGKRAGLRTIAVRTGHGLQDGLHDVEPDFVVKNLLEAVERIRVHAS